MLTDGTKGRDEIDLSLAFEYEPPFLPLSGLFVEIVRCYSSSCCKPKPKNFIPLHFPSSLVILTLSIPYIRESLFCLPSSNEFSPASDEARLNPYFSSVERVPG
uniref:Uncharacterized protein orf103d n=1 Tax=Beta vulgaris subsp. maritima TaxID=350892 RepID=F4MKW7_BETVM|nr:hypothetical protein [Beta vulgaris subsp. maritima]